MQREIILTNDGSHTIAIPAIHATYHSLHGAIQESMHVFIHAGLDPLLDTFAGQPLHILEVGMGTGLNALLTRIRTATLRQPIHYTAIEPYPLGKEEAVVLNYCTQLKQPALQPWFDQLHGAEWEMEIEMPDQFTLLKTKIPLPELAATQPFNLVYFDAFAPGVQPEIWTEDVFKKIYSLSAPGAMLVTYCSKSVVRRALQAAGFRVEKIPGPWGKREMIRTIR